MADLHTGLLPRATHVAVEGVDILPSPGSQNAELCHPSTSWNVFKLILLYPVKEMLQF